MNYDLLAERLIDLQLILHASTINQAMSELDKGTFFALHYLLVHQRRAYSKEISHQMAVSTARVATLLNHLEKQGWIQRHHDPHDNRQVIVEMTDEGYAFISKKRAQAARLLAQLFSQLGEEDTREYLRISRKLIQIILTNDQKEKEELNE